MLDVDVTFIFGIIFGIGLSIMAVGIYELKNSYKVRKG